MTMFACFLFRTFVTGCSYLWSTVHHLTVMMPSCHYLPSLNMRFHHFFYNFKLFTCFRCCLLLACLRFTAYPTFTTVILKLETFVSAQSLTIILGKNQTKIVNYKQLILSRSVCNILYIFVNFHSSRIIFRHYCNL